MNVPVARSILPQAKSNLNIRFNNERTCGAFIIAEG
jgi:hypothetical protein